METDAAGRATRVSAGQRYNSGSRRTPPNGAEHRLAGLITRRSQVQILPPLLNPRILENSGVSLFAPEPLSPGPKPGESRGRNHPGWNSCRRREVSGRALR